MLALGVRLPPGEHSWASVTRSLEAQCAAAWADAPAGAPAGLLACAPGARRPLSVLHWPCAPSCRAQGSSRSPTHEVGPPLSGKGLGGHRPFPWTSAEGEGPVGSQCAPRLAQAHCAEALRHGGHGWRG